MKKFIILPLCFLCAFIVKAQVEISNQGNAKTQNMFYEEILNFSSVKSNSTRIDVYIQVPYTTIQFIKSNGQFTGSYTATVSVFDENEDKLIEEKTWNEKITVNTFQETVSNNNYSLTLRSFYLKPTKYSIRTSVQDKDSKRDYTKKAFYTVRNMKGKISASDVLLISKYSSGGGKKKIIPNISKNVADIKNGLPFFFEIYSRISGKIDIDYTIYDNHKELIYHEDQTKNIDTGTTRIFHVIHDSSFSLGNYKLTIALKDGENNVLTSVSKQFFSRWVGVPSTVRDLDKAIQQLVYIASPSAIDSIQEAKSKEERLKLYLNYWKRMDPTPNTEDNPIFDEYYRRVAYANAHFTQYIEGWRTDRGMVYILLGPPNSVDRHPFDIDAKPYVVWEYYNINRSFVFVDETGFGDYRLVTPLTGDLYKFRYNR